MAQSATPALRFPVVGPLPVSVDFLGGQLTSDGGLSWIAEAEQALGLTVQLVSAVPDQRHHCHHPIGSLLAQRIYQIACGYDDQSDPTHGQQEGTAHHGYYGQYQYHPLLVFDGQTGHLITAVLRPGTVHASHGVVAILKRIVRSLRARWPRVTIELRADSGFAIPALYDWCEVEGIGYTIGLGRNDRLELAIADLQVEAERQSAAQGGAKVRLLGETTYQAASWPHARRVVMKAEVLAPGTNRRFVVTSRSDVPERCYDWYVGRGQTENWIKDLKRGCFADRLSCHRFWANQVRLLLHAAAYWLLDTLRRWLIQAQVAPMTLETLRLRLLKIGGWVRERADHVHLRLASSHPSEGWWRRLDHLRHHPS